MSDQPKPLRDSSLVRRARRGRALDLLEWERAFGSSPVSKEEWAGTLRPDLSERSAYRSWLRLREHWERDGVAFELIATTSSEDPTRKVLVQITKQAVEWAKNVLDETEEGDEMLELLARRPDQIPPPRDHSGTHAAGVVEQAAVYLAAVSTVREGGPVASLLVRELLSLASWYPDLGVPLHRLAEDLWDIPVQLVPRIAAAAGLRVYSCGTERWLRRDEAEPLLAELLGRGATS